jgi:pyridoxamine 5'-phosphate oxidase-like protein
MPHKSPLPAASRPFMPEYGLKKATEGHGLLPWRWAQSRLLKSHNYWIATTRPGGRPHVMPVWGLWLDDAFYFSTGAKSRKARNLAANSHCVICTENAAQAVVLEGRAKKFSLRRNRAFFRCFVADYKKKYNWKIDGTEGNFYAVRPRVVFGLWEKDFLGASTRWLFPER